MAGRTSFLGGGVLLGVLVVALGVHYGATRSVAAAELERTVHLGTAVKMQPVAIVKVALGPSTVQLGRWDKPARETPDPDTPFTGDDNWLQELTVYVLNRTDRPIAFLTLQLDFREHQAAFSGTAMRNCGGRPAGSARLSVSSCSTSSRPTEIKGDARRVDRRPQPQCVITAGDVGTSFTW